ncbi:hypothetical protein ACHAXH_008765 [Discostella pseudostelligera]
MMDHCFPQPQYVTPLYLPTIPALQPKVNIMSYNYDDCVNSIEESRRRAYAGAVTTAAADDDDVANSSAVIGPSAAPDLEALQQSMDGFANLSAHCPMTPLLWMQYAYDSENLIEGLMMMEYSTMEGGDDQQKCHHKMQCRKSALESSTGILQLALTEFLGCALLHLYYLESLADYIYHSEELHHMNSQNGIVGMEGYDRRAMRDNLSTAFERAWESVGRGTHVNEGMIVSEIYRLHGSFLLFSLSSAVTELKAQSRNGNSVTIDDSETNAISQQLFALLLRWSKTPMGEGSNDEMMQDMEYLWDEACSLILSLYDEENQQMHRKSVLEQQKAALWETMDNERKNTSSLTNVLSSYENEIDVAMSNEGIALPMQTLFHSIPEQSNGNDILGIYAQSLKKSSAKWNPILLDDKHRFLLGFGGSETSRAFMKAISFLQRIYLDMMKRGKAVDVADSSPVECCIVTYQSSFIISLYERAVSECPTVEQLWTSYLNFLKDERTRRRSQMNGGSHQNEELASTLQSVSHRAVTNCPYSCALFEIRMTTLGLISASNLDPDDIHAVIKEATDLGFLTSNREAMLYLRLVAILVVKRRLLNLISMGTTATSSVSGKDYDGSEAGTISCTSLSPNDTEEVRDLLEDIRDMYDEIDTYLFNSHPAWSEGKAAFWKNRALTEAYVLCPIDTALTKHEDDEFSEDDSAMTNKKAVQCFEKLVKAQKPSHPDSWREYIRYTMQSQPSNIAATVSSLRRLRGLYNRAMSSVKKASQEPSLSVDNKQSWMGTGVNAALLDRDYDSSLIDLCREYLEFERNYGSLESFSHAQTQVRSKLMNWNPSVPTTAPLPHIEEHSRAKRKLETNNVATETNVSIRDEAMGEDEDDQILSKRAKVKTNLKQPKKSDSVHKVRIGKLEYPAHPFTIHVSKLSKETQDMDLVDTFSHEVGAVVHAKILREKLTGKGGHHYHGESKCSGLVQFEERSSVENALQKDGLLEIGGKSVKIQRSHLPAVGLVPAGMHRVNPKGEGKMSKRNELRKKNTDSETKGSGAKSNIESMDIDDGGRGNKKQESAGNDRTKEKMKSPSITSPSSLSFGILSLKPTHVRPKPKITLDSKKR